MPPKAKYFVLGATGYIGGCVLERFLEHPDARGSEITALVRSPEKAGKFREFGVNAIVGSFSDIKLLEDLTAAADFVFHMADADNIDVARAVLRGSKRSFRRTGKPQILIHTSGIAIISDNAAGLHAPDVIWDDTDADGLETIPNTAPHRNADVEIIQADNEGYVKAYLVAPATIYGVASGKLVDAGLANKHSIQIPALIRASIKRGQVGMVGTGANSWSNAHIDEVVDFYINLYDAIQENPDAVRHGRKGYYFPINGDHVLYDVCKEIGRVLAALGKSQTAEPKTFTKEDMNRYFTGRYFTGFDIIGTNCVGVANNPKTVGWKPKKTTKDLLASIRPEVEEIIKAQRR